MVHVALLKRIRLARIGLLLLGEVTGIMSHLVALEALHQTEVDLLEVVVAILAMVAPMVLTITSSVMVVAFMPNAIVAVVVASLAGIPAVVLVDIVVVSAPTVVIVVTIVFIPMPVKTRTSAAIAK